MAFLPLLNSSVSGFGPSDCGSIATWVRSIGSSGYTLAVFSRMVCASTISVATTALV